MMFKDLSMLSDTNVSILLSIAFLVLYVYLLYTLVWSSSSQGMTLLKFGQPDGHDSCVLKHANVPLCVKL